MLRFLRATTVLLLLCPPAFGAALEGRPVAHEAELAAACIAWRAAVEQSPTPHSPGAQAHRRSFVPARSRPAILQTMGSPGSGRRAAPADGRRRRRGLARFRPVAERGGHSVADPPALRAHRSCRLRVLNCRHVPADLDVAAAVAALAKAPDVAAAVAAVEPHFYHYALLKSALLRYRALAAQPELTQLPRSRAQGAACGGRLCRRTGVAQAAARPRGSAAGRYTGGCAMPPSRG